MKQEGSYPHRQLLRFGPALNVYEKAVATLMQRACVSRLLGEHSGSVAFSSGAQHMMSSPLASAGA